SVTERRAMKAERETADRLIAHHLVDRIGASFQGRISGVTRAGLFVKLDDTGADGLVPIRSLGAEYFNYDETRHALVGSRSGAMPRWGDAVDARLVDAKRIAGALRFGLLSEATDAPRGGLREGRGARRAEDKARTADRKKPAESKGRKSKSNKSKGSK